MPKPPFDHLFQQPEEAPLYAALMGIKVNTNNPNKPYMSGQGTVLDTHPLYDLMRSPTVDPFQMTHGQIADQLDADDVTNMEAFEEHRLQQEALDPQFQNLNIKKWNVPQNNQVIPPVVPKPNRNPFLPGGPFPKG